MKDDIQPNQSARPEDEFTERQDAPQSAQQYTSEESVTPVASLSNEPIELAVEAEPATQPVSNAGEDSETTGVTSYSHVQPQSDLPQPDSTSGVSSPVSSVVEPASVSQSETLQPASSTAPVGGAPTGFPTPTNEKKGKKKLLVGGLVVGALLLLGGGGAAAYNMWYQNPDKVLSDAVVNMVQAESIAYTGSIDLLNLAEEDDSITTDVKSIKLKLDGKSNSVIGAQLATLSVDYKSKVYELKGAAQVDKDANIYAKIDGVKKLLNQLAAENNGKYEDLPKSIRDAIDKLDGTWIRIGADDLKQVDDEYSKTKECTDDVMKMLKDDDAMTEELVEMYKKHPFVLVKEKLPAQDGSLGYVIEGDTKKAASFAKEANKSKLAKELQKCDETFTLDEKDIDESLKNEEKSDTEARFEVWVDRWSHEFTKANLTFKDKDMSAAVVIEPIFNQPVSVKTPEKFITISELKQIYEDTMKAYEQESSVSTEETTTEVMSGSFSTEL